MHFSNEWIEYFHTAVLEIQLSREHKPSTQHATALNMTRGVCKGSCFPGLDWSVQICPKQVKRKRSQVQVFKQRFYFEIAAQSSNSALDSRVASFPTHPHWNVCASPVMMSGIYLRPPFPIIILIILLLLCSILIGWCWHNLPTQTFFLPFPGARPVFLANYRSLSEMICNVASFQWITLTSPIYMTCQYPSPFSHITRGKEKEEKQWCGAKNWAKNDALSKSLLQD